MSAQADKDEAVSQSTPETSEGRKGLGQRLRALGPWAKSHRLVAALIGVGGLLLLGGLVALLMLLPGKSHAVAVSADEILAALDRGAVDEAKLLLEQSKTHPEKSEIPPFVESVVLAATATEDAAKAAPQAKRTFSTLAARYLEEALTQGIPKSRQADVQYRLGKNLFDAGQMAESRSAFGKAIEAQSPRTAEIRFLLAATYLRDPKPQLDKAMAENKLLLATEKLPSSLRQDGLVQKAEILLGIGQNQPCLDVIQSLSPNVRQNAATTVLRGRALLAEARQTRSQATSPEFAASSRRKAPSGDQRVPRSSRKR